MNPKDYPIIDEQSEQDLEDCQISKPTQDTDLGQLPF
jgi:hypothetical protein